MNELFTRIRNIGIIPVIKLDSPDQALPLAKALMDGGITAAEFTFRTSAAKESIRQIRKTYPEMLCGAGTVLTIDMAKDSIEAGAQFVVSPGFNPKIVDFCIEHKMPIVPGVSTPSDIELALEKGLSVLKFFPAEASGGTTMLDAFAGPFPQVQFMATGGIGQNNIGEYVKRKNLLAIGGSWMVKSDLIDKKDWAGITALSREAVLSMHGFEFMHMGINQDSAEEAAKTTALFELLGQKSNEGTSSYFNEKTIEVMKTPFYGAKGHIGFKTWDIERALAYFELQGFKARPESIKYSGAPEKSPISVAYLDKEIGGFAIHLVRAK